ncbi:lipopolysaccharide heptosyltransferase family protein [Flavobacteriaceae bacterium]|nr:lipopolysaccharide heptosyltransferase family protein [Flavobacteriaceae bacterium]
MKILIIQQKMIGDVLTSSLLCENLKLWNPKVIIHFVANDFTLPVIQGNPHIDKLIVFESTFQSDYQSFFHFLRSFKKTDYDYVIDAYGKIESTLITFFSKSKVKIGYAKSYNQYFYSTAIKSLKKSKKGLPLAIENRMLLLNPIINNSFQNVFQPKIYLAPEEIEEAKQELAPLLSQNKKLVMVAITGSQESKTYPMEYMAALLDTIAEQLDARIVLNYLPHQQQQVTECLSQAKSETRKCIYEEKYPISLRNYMQWVYHCDAVIGNEGGTINIAKALSKPTFAVFSPIINDAAWHLDNDSKHQAVHLKSFCPDCFKGSQENGVASLYKKFHPNFFIEKFKTFLNEF